MNAVFRIIFVSLKYLVNIAPLIYAGTEWGIKIAKELRGRKKIVKVTKVTHLNP